MGSQADYWTDLYATTHEQRLAQSMEAARAELKEKYGLDKEYLEWLAEKQKMYELELTKVQGALTDYQKSRSSGGAAPADNTAALLGVIAEAGNTIARETGDAAQRELQAEAAVMERYRLSAEQTNAIGKTGTYFGTKFDPATATSSADIQRAINNALGEIPPGTIGSGTDAAKTASAEAYARISGALAGNAIFNRDPALKVYLQQQISSKFGTDPSMVGRAAVEADRKSAISGAQRTVGRTGTGTSAQAARLAKEELDRKLKDATPEQREAVSSWVSSDAGRAYLGELQASGDYEKALAAAAAAKKVELPKDENGNVPPGAAEALVFDIEVKDKAGKVISKTDIRNLLESSNASYDIKRFFDPTYISLYGRTKALETGIQQTFQEREQKMRSLAVPTEEEVRRRGAEIYEPISPGLRGRVKEGEARLGESEARSRMTGMPMSDDDLMAQRLIMGAPGGLSDAKKILAGASAGAIRALDSGWTPESIGRVRRSGEQGSDADVTGRSTAMDLEEFDTTMDGPAVELGRRMYSNVKERQLRDTSPDALVKYASDLAGNDPGLRDALLQEYYKFAGYDMRGIKAMKSKTDVEKVEEPKPTDLSGIKPEDLEF